MPQAAAKFSNPDTTAKGEVRAWVDPVVLKTLWFNTGTLCNLECANCYIESSPKNDRLVYISKSEVAKFLEEILEKNMKTEEIAFTGGEPFMNPEMLPIIELCLDKGFRVLVLTNAMKPMLRRKEQLLSLKEKHGHQLQLRVSIDHYTQELHEEERGPRSWPPMLQGLKWLSENGFNISAAGRTMWNENDEQMRKGYKKLFADEKIKIDVSNPEKMILFPEMDEKAEVPEITTACWDILKVNPDDIMCATSRMVIKRKGDNKPVVAACTLLPYEDEFVLGENLQQAFTDSRIKLNHPHCAKFCVLGGGSCTA